MTPASMIPLLSGEVSVLLVPGVRSAPATEVVPIDAPPSTPPVVRPATPPTTTSEAPWKPVPTTSTERVVLAGGILTSIIFSLWFLRSR